MLKDTYGLHSDKTIEILLDYTGYNVSELRKLSQTERVNHVVDASYDVKQWLLTHFINIRLVELGKRILTVVNAYE